MPMMCHLSAANYAMLGRVTQNLDDPTLTALVESKVQEETVQEAMKNHLIELNFQVMG